MLDKDRKDTFSALLLIWGVIFVIIILYFINFCLCLVLFGLLLQMCFDVWGYGDNVVLFGGIFSGIVATVFSYFLSRMKKYFVMIILRSWLWAHPHNNVHGKIEKIYREVKGNT